MILFTGSGALASAYSKQFSCKIISARLLSEFELQKAISEADTIIHNAAKINCTDAVDGIDNNFLLTKHILDTAYKINSKARFIFISSMSILETDEKYKSISKMTPYAFSKYLSEIYCLKHLHQNVSCVRFSTIFYKDPEKDGLSKLIYDAVTTNQVNLFNQGVAQRDFIPIDIAAQYLQKLTQNNILGQINIVGGNKTSFRDVVEMIRNCIEIKINNADAPNATILADFSKKAVSSIGEIQFSIESEIKAYLYNLQK